MDAYEIEAKLLDVIERCRGLGLPAHELDEMASVAKAGECGVALENLCTQLLEYDAVVSIPVLESIKKLGAVLGIDEKYWSRLEAIPS
jgi:hypothetical protein